MPLTRYFAFLLLLLIAPAILAAETVLVGEGDTLRGLSERHLGDSELWPEFLRANDLQSVAEVRPGMRLKLPAPEIIETEKLLRQTRETIQQANRLRAQLFATREIATAIAMNDSALEQKRLGNWSQALQLIRKSASMADQALTICEQKRNVAAEAQLVDMRGGVERRRPADAAWRRTELYDMLAEGERVRTLANASAELLFRDESRLRMDENSQLVIREMRANLVENRQQAKVSLVSGDLFAVLGGSASRDAFDVEVPGIQLEGSSRDFYVKQTETDTKLANYQGQLQVAAQGSKVLLEENEGVAVDEAGISGKRALLPRPRAQWPADAELLYTEQVSPRWEEVEGASHYWIEVASDANFKNLRLSDREVPATTVELAALGEGTWYWRVAAVDEEGFPGPRSSTRNFQVIMDREPPFLSLQTPEEGEVLASQMVGLRGTVEAGARLTLNGEPVQPEADGDFNLVYPAELGDNQLRLVAEDVAGNLTEETRNFRFVPEPELFLELSQGLHRDSEGRLLASGRALTLHAATLPGSVIQAVTAEQRKLASARANQEGRVSLSVPLLQSPQSLVLQATSPGGKTLEQSLELVAAEQPPRIELGEEPPASTREEELRLDGRVFHAEKLLLDDEPVNLGADGRFQATRRLSPGLNTLVLRAVDALGRSSEIRRQLLLDLEPPALASQSLKFDRLSDGRQLRIRLTATDSSSLLSSAPFVLRQGDFEQVGALLLDSDQTSYQGLVIFPADLTSGSATLVVNLSDSLGNRRILELRP